MLSWARGRAATASTNRGTLLSGMDMMVGVEGRVRLYWCWCWCWCLRELLSCAPEVCWVPLLLLLLLVVVVALLVAA